MKNDSIKNYIRVGTNYFRMSNKPSAYKDNEGKRFIEKCLTPWKKDEIATDHGKDSLKEVIKYIGFCNIPSHTDYEQEVAGYYNQYVKIEHEPKQGKFPLTEMYLRHVFGEQYELGLDYLAILYLKPTRRLPILCLVSEEQVTGKSTMVFWLKDVFQSNVTLNSNEEFETNFNSDWTGKLLIGCEETLIDKKETYEMLKRLSTTGTTKVESKGVNKTEEEFFGKFVLCSNYETTFVPMHKDETRFWVRKINTVRNSQNGEITNLRQQMQEEIPAFLHFIKERGIKSPDDGRLWFAPEKYETEALNRAKEANRPKAEREIIEVIGERMELHDLKEICFAAKDLYALVKEAGLRADKLYIDRIIKDNLGKTVFKNSSYTLYSDTETISTQKKGRYYKFTYKEIFGKEHPSDTQNKESESEVAKTRTLKSEDSVNELFMTEEERVRERTKRFSQGM